MERALMAGVAERLLHRSLRGGEGMSAHRQKQQKAEAVRQECTDRTRQRTSFHSCDLSPFVITVQELPAVPAFLPPPSLLSSSLCPLLHRSPSYVAQASVKLELLTPRASECWDYGRVPSDLAKCLCFR